MYEKLESCPSCKHPQFDNYLICEDHQVTHESFALVKCTNCELIFTNPRPQSHELTKYYQSKDYISHTDEGNSLINVLYKLVRSYTLKKKRQLIEKYSTPGMILDYGCGTGDFLKVCEKSQWLTTGIEPDSGAMEIAKTKLNGTVVDSLGYLKNEKTFDVITMWHVIEHVSQLKETLKKLHKQLKQGGYMIVAVPNPNSFDASLYREHWAAYDVPRHLYHFTRTSFGNLVEKTKLKFITTHPLKFDSYYVSLLSEKNKSGKMKLISGFLNGLRSNRKANKSSEYSSLIYVLKK